MFWRRHLEDRWFYRRFHSLTAHDETAVGVLAAAEFLLSGSDQFLKEALQQQANDANASFSTYRKLDEPTLVPHSSQSSAPDGIDSNDPCFQQIDDLHMLAVF